MKYKKFAALLMATVLMMNLCGCRKEEEEPEIPPEPVDPNFPITLELSGETITLHEAPERIVSLSPAITELFCDLGEEGLLKGVSSYDSLSETDCGTAQAVDLEAVEKLSPELLFTDTPLMNEELKQLQQMDVEVLYLPRPQTITEITDRAELILLALYGKEDGAEKAAEFTDNWNEEWRPLKDCGIAVADTDRKNVVLLADLDLVAGGDCWEGQMLEELAMNNLAAEGKDWQLPQVQTAEDGTKSYSYGETAVEWNPDVIFYRSELDAESIKASELYANSTAVANGALYPVDWTVLQMQNGDLPELFASMTEQVYPDVWKMVQDAIAEEKAAEEAAAAEQAAAETEKTEE